MRADPARYSDVPCVQAGRFEAAGGVRRQPVTRPEPTRHSVVAHGPRLEPGAVWTDPAGLHAYSHTNPTVHRRPRLEQVVANRAEITSGIIAGALHEWIVPWFVPGVPRLHHLLATGRLTPEDGARRCAIATFGPRWQPIVEEALRLRSGRRGGDARCAAELLEDVTASSTMVIEAGLALAAPPVDNKPYLWTTSS